MRGRAGGRGRPERQRRKTWTFRKFVSAGVGQRPALCRRPPSADLTSATIKETGGDAHSSRSVLGDETRRSRLYFCGGSFASCRSVPRVRRARRASPTELATRSSVAPHLSAEASSPCCGGKGGGGICLFWNVRRVWEARIPRCRATAAVLYKFLERIESAVSKNEAQFRPERRPLPVAVSLM